jgi:hypothetical protein
LNIPYVPKSAAMVVWGLVLSVVGAGLGTWLSIAAVGELIRDASSMFYDSSAGAFSGWALLFGLVALAGFVLLAAGISRVLGRIDQKYDVVPVPAGRSGGPAGPAGWLPAGRRTARTRAICTCGDLSAHARHRTETAAGIARLR